MNLEDLITELEQEWDLETGFLGVLRYGQFHLDKLERLVSCLERIPPFEEFVPRRLVSLTWYIPLFMIWQKERVIEENGDFPALDSAIDRVTNLLEEKLGTP